MTEIIRQKIFAKLQQLDEYFSYLEKLKKEIKSEKEFLSNFHYFGLVERYLQLSCQVLIDTINLLIIEKDLEKPENVQEAVGVLADKKIISQKLALRLRGIVGFRNILVHEYGKIDRQKVYQYFSKNLDDFKLFKKEILTQLKR